MKGHIIAFGDVPKRHILLDHDRLLFFEWGVFDQNCQDADYDNQNNAQNNVATHSIY